MSVSKDNPPNLRFLLRQLKHDAMEAIRSCQVGYATVERTSNERIYDVIGFIAAFAAHLRASQSDMRNFLRHEYWDDKPHEPKAKNVVILASMYVVGARESKGALYQQARTYSRIVNHFLNAETDPVDIPLLLKRKTIHRLIDEIDALRDQDASAAVEDPVDRQAQAKGAKPDDVVRGSSRDDEVYISNDDEGSTDINDDEAEAADSDTAIDEVAPAAITTPNDDDEDLFDGIPDPKQERREWEKALIKRVRAAWSDGYEVLLVPTPKQIFDDVVQRDGDGYVELKCEYARSEDWQALKCLQAKAL